MTKQYESTWPGGFRDTVPKKVRTMAITKKHIKVESAKVYDTNLSYSCIIGLQASGWDMNLSEVLKYGLAPIPTSMCTNIGEMRLTTRKTSSKLKSQEDMHPKQPVSSLIVQPYCGWFTGQHKEQANASLAITVVSYVMCNIKDADVYLIFDKYEEYNI